MNRPNPDANNLISAQDDPRTFQRFALDILVFVRLSGEAPPGGGAAAHDERLYTLQAVSVKDIGMTGLFFFSPLTYPVGADLEVCVCMTGTEHLVPAVVKRRARVNNQLCGYGINFRQSQISKELRMALAAHLLRRADHLKGAG